MEIIEENGVKFDEEILISKLLDGNVEPVQKQFEEDDREQSDNSSQNESTSEDQFSKEDNVISKPGSYFYEYNKLLFIQRFLDMLTKLGFTYDTQELEKTDFHSSLLLLLKEHAIEFPKENIPKFDILSDDSEDD